MDDTAIANMISEFVDKDFALCDKKKGWDCLNSLMTFYESFGYQFPIEYMGWTKENYGIRWGKDQKEGRKIFGEFLLGLGHEIAFSEILRGDLLIFQAEELGIFPGIYLGNGNIFMVFDKGAKVIPLKVLKSKLINIKRMIGNNV